MGILINLKGKKFGKLVVLEYEGNSIWKCQCECGKIKKIHSQALRENKVISCGCNKRKDLVGQKFGRLLVIERIGFINKRTYYKCKCDCGNIVDVLASNLTKGTSKSCGCYAKELSCKRSTTHNMSNTRLYNIWEGMKQRCYNSNVKAYKYYGAKDIKVCEKWLNFENFMQWSLNNGYSDNLTIDRIDIKKDYCPENCRWVNKKIQANNTSTNVFLKIDNITDTIANWSKKTGINASTISWRYRHGWSEKDCIQLKPNYLKRKQKPKIEIKNIN
jgi:hypothetical protein